MVALRPGQLHAMRYSSQLPMSLGIDGTRRSRRPPLPLNLLDYFFSSPKTTHYSTRATCTQRPSQVTLNSTCRPSVWGDEEPHTWRVCGEAWRCYSKPCLYDPLRSFFARSFSSLFGNNRQGATIMGLVPCLNLLENYTSKYSRYIRFFFLTGITRC